MREMAPSLFRLLQVGHKLLCFVPFVTDARQQSDPDKKNIHIWYRIRVLVEGIISEFEVDTFSTQVIFEIYLK